MRWGNKMINQNISPYIDPQRSALLIIDMEKAFVNTGAALWIRGALETVPRISNVIDEARDSGISVIWIKRIYKADGSDMELPRRQDLFSRGLYGVLAPESTGLNSIEEPDGLERKQDEKVIIKPRFSAFFHTELDEYLRGKGIDTVLLAGTTTPNCIRCTCYDAISLDYQCIVLEPCCSSQTSEIQAANINDMERVGAEIWWDDSILSLLPE